ncbi:MAG: hypothetical protein B1H40_00870 [Candidatus Latescibacteria bacterium 4484_181]|nr:MAG: hypothetical protein B1H40_00870 [Candidatus Latescibacteria bacterium 4484_181]RKY73252.1 MAG: hypothetical protein DRQ24_02700 [Candidatus Latescibacterota bacterium]
MCVRCGRAFCQQCQTVVNSKFLCSSCFEEEPFKWFDFRFAFRNFVFFVFRCPHCGRPVRKDFKLCPYCQTPLKAECPSCGRPLDSDWVACRHCGHKTSPSN